MKLVHTYACMVLVFSITFNQMTHTTPVQWAELNQETQTYLAELKHKEEKLNKKIASLFKKWGEEDKETRQVAMGMLREVLLLEAIYKFGAAGGETVLRLLSR